MRDLEGVPFQIPRWSAFQHAPALRPPLVSTAPGEAWRLLSTLRAFQALASQHLSFLLSGPLGSAREVHSAAVEFYAHGEVVGRLAEMLTSRPAKPGGVLTSEGEA
jgi:hypothetical protein